MTITHKLGRATYAAAKVAHALFLFAAAMLEIGMFKLQAAAQKRHNQSAMNRLRNATCKTRRKWFRPATQAKVG